MTNDRSVDSGSHFYSHSVNRGRMRMIHHHSFLSFLVVARDGLRESSLSMLAV